MPAASKNLVSDLPLPNLTTSVSIFRLRCQNAGTKTSSAPCAQHSSRNGSGKAKSQQMSSPVPIASEVPGTGRSNAVCEPTVVLESESEPEPVSRLGPGVRTPRSGCQRLRFW